VFAIAALRRFRCASPLQRVARNAPPGPRASAQTRENCRNRGIGSWLDSCDSYNSPAEADWFGLPGAGWDEPGDASVVGGFRLLARTGSCWLPTRMRCGSVVGEKLVHAAASIW